MSKTVKTKPEKIIESEIFYYLRSKGIFCFKVVSNGYFDPVRKTFRKQQSPFFMTGVADICGILPDGKFLAIEVKSQKGKASPDQTRFLEKIAARGGCSIIARSADEVKLWLELKGYEV